MKKFNNPVGEINRVFISPYYTKFQSSPTVENGVLGQQSSYVEYRVVDNVDSSEFSLGNLIAIGAADKLTYVSMSLNSDMNFVDNFSVSYNQVLNDVQENS